jgi:uncharacterized protein with HEPN domain
MERDPRKYLWDARRAAQSVLAYVEGKTFDEVMADEIRRMAVERQLQIVGEAVAQLARIDPVTAERLPGFREVIAFRNILVHVYYALNYARVWQVIELDLPRLVSNIDAILGDR